MTGPLVSYKYLLAKDLLRDHFGETIQRVGSLLMDHGRLSLLQLFTKLNFNHLSPPSEAELYQQNTARYTFAMIRTALLSMIYHNIVRFATEEEYLQEAKKRMEQTLVGVGLDDDDSSKKKKKKSSEDEEEEDGDGEASSAAAAKPSKSGVVIAGSKTKKKSSSASTPKPSSAATSATSSEPSAASSSGASAAPTTQSKSASSSSIIDQGHIAYDILIDRVLIRGKFARFLYIVRERHGEHAETLLRLLLVHGRLSKYQLLYLIKNEPYMLDGSTRTPSDMQLSIVFDDLVAARILALVPESYLPKGMAGVASSAASSGSASDGNSAVANARKRAASAMTIDDDEDDDLMEISPDEASASAAKRRKTGAQSSVGISGSSAEEDALAASNVYMPNFDQFVRLVRHYNIIYYVYDKINPIGASVVRSIITLTGGQERTRDTYQSTKISFNSLLSAMNQSEEAISGKNLQMYLDRMSKESAGGATQGVAIVEQITSGYYALNMGKICDVIKRKYIEAIIEVKFGIIGARIFRLLLIKRQLEQKQVAEYAMVPLNEARNLLYEMYEDGILYLQEVPRSADHNPYRTFFLWNVTDSAGSELSERMLEVLCKTIRNLRMRLAKEQRDAMETIGGNVLTGGFSAATNLSREQQYYLKRLEKFEDRLEASIIHLNDLLLGLEFF